MAEDARTILSYLKDPNSRYGAHTWQSVNGEVKVQWLPDEGRGWIDIENPKGVKGASGFRKLMRSTLPKLDVISEIPAKWEWNPDDIKKGGIYEYLGPKMKGSFKANPNMPNKASIWDTRPKAKGTIMGVKKKTTNPQTLDEFKAATKAEIKDIVDRNIAKAHKEIPGFTERLAAKKLTREDSKFLRTDIRRNILGPGNEELISKNVSGYAQGRVKQPGLGSKESEVRSKVKRKTSKLVQTDARIDENLLTKEFIDETVAEKLKYWDNPSDAFIEAHHIRMLNMYEPFFEGLSPQDQKRLTQFATDARYPLGDVKANIALLDKEFHTILHNYMKEEGFQLYGGGVTTKHGIPALGNTFESRKAALGVFFTNVQDPIEKKMFSVQWDQHAKHKPPTQAELQHGLEWINDDDVRKAEQSLLARDGDVSKIQYGSGPEPDILKRMSRATKLASNLGRGESAVRLAGGDVVGGTAGLALSTPFVQKQAAKALGKFAIKSIPFVSLGSGLIQGAAYGMSGQYAKAGLSVAGGIIGEAGPVGDVIQAGMDVAMEVDDQFGKQKAKTKYTSDSMQPDKKLLHSVGSLRIKP